MFAEDEREAALVLVMVLPEFLLQAPAAGAVALGRTLPSLLDEVRDRNPNAKALNQWRSGGWQPLSTEEFCVAAEELALGLQRLTLAKGDRVALLMHSDVPFCIADMGCLLAGLVDVPIDLTETIEHILYILHHSEARALIVSDLNLLKQISPYLHQVPALESVIVAQVPEDWPQVRSQFRLSYQNPDAPNGFVIGHLSKESGRLQVPSLFGGQVHSEPVAARFPSQIHLWSMAEVRGRGRRSLSDEMLQQLRDAIAPQDLATILYIAGPASQPRGVMLTHENISGDILAAFSSHPTVGRGAEEVVLSFLPLTHIFARAFLYGHLNYGHSLYFSSPSRVARHFQSVKPTVVITVPRLLEKVYSRIVDKGQRLKGWKRGIFDWALGLAQRHQVGCVPSVWEAWQLQLADRLVFRHWRAGFGGRLKTIISGGAALRADVANSLSAAGIPLSQGYGLTETSAVLCYTRGYYDRAGTVGVPIPGVQIALAMDGEILVNAPYVMVGYYKDPEATRAAIDEAGWLRTGDLGTVTKDGLLQVTGCKKSLFKLSTGKYVAPLPLEAQLRQSPLVSGAIAVGDRQKFCAMLIAPHWPELRSRLQSIGLEPVERLTAELLQHPCITALYQVLVDEANCHLPYWATVRQFRLLDPATSKTLIWEQLQRFEIRQQLLQDLAPEIEALYRNQGRVSETAELDSPPSSGSDEMPCGDIPAATCPTFAQSLTHY